jgi:hypothetical protein
MGLIFRKWRFKVADETMALSTLTARLETATEADQAEVLEMAFDALVPQPDWIAGWDAWNTVRYNFNRMIKSDAYESAAFLIMRETLPGWHIHLLTEDRHGGSIGLEIRKGGLRAKGRSLLIPVAILAAICAAKGDGDAVPGM